MRGISKIYIVELKISGLIIMISCSGDFKCMLVVTEGICCSVIF
nr:MAG TPA: hypothetical protein [Caudoviricetes sp.]